MKKLLLLAFLFTSFLCEAQFFQSNWQKGFEYIGGADFTLALTNDTNYVIGLEQNGFEFIKTEGINKEFTDPLFGLNHSFCRSGIFYCNNIINIKDNDYVFCYLSTLWNTNCDQNSNTYKIGIAKTSNYELKWTKYFTGNFPSNIIETYDKNFIFGGNIGTGNTDIIIHKIDSLGNLIWQKNIEADKRDVIVSISETKDHGYILGIQSNSNISMDKTTPNNGGTDYWIIKLNENGVIELAENIWRKC